MAFNKTGSPQPINVLPDKCQICGVNNAEFNVGGKLVCSACRDNSQQEQPQTKED